jgi:hypothetical protein
MNPESRSHHRLVRAMTAAAWSKHRHSAIAPETSKAATTDWDVVVSFDGITFYSQTPSTGTPTSLLKVDYDRTECSFSIHNPVSPMASCEL